MPRLVALALLPGPGFVEALQRAWAAGDAVLPLDARWPAPALERLLDALCPAVVVGDDGGEHRRPGGGVPVEPGDALVVTTSGSTGDPKGVILTHDAVAASAEATSARLGVDPDRDRWLACLPVAHVGGLSVITRALHTGTPLEVLPRFQADAVIDAARRGATRTSLVATALARIDPSAFRSILLGGAAPPEALPPNVVVTYGMTETGSGVVYDGVPLDGVDVRIAADGEIHLRGPQLLRAYRSRGDTADADPKDADGWLATDDAGAFDEHGRLVVHGRRGDLIVTGGEKVWPTTVEAVLARNPSVAEVMVTGEPDPSWGHAVVAVVVPADPADPPALDDLRGTVKAELPAYCAPHRLELVTSLPRTRSGKVQRRRS